MTSTQPVLLHLSPSPSDQLYRKRPSGGDLVAGIVGEQSCEKLLSTRHEEGQAQQAVQDAWDWWVGWLGGWLVAAFGLIGLSCYLRRRPGRTRRALSRRSPSGAP